MTVERIILVLAIGTAIAGIVVLYYWVLIVRELFFRRRRVVKRSAAYERVAIARALASDWNAVGRDMQAAIARAERELNQSKS